MTIKNNIPLSMAETEEYLSKDSEITKFIKKFTKKTPAKARELKNKLEELDLMKMKEEQVSKIIDLAPENSEDLNKIFMGTNLDEDETNKILDITKQFK